MSHAFEKFDLHGRTAVVTGGATGIGFNMVQALARAGAKVLIGARRENVLLEAQATLQADPLIDEILIKPVDLGNRASIREFIDYANTEMGGVDILVCNAAQLMFEPLAEIADSTIDEMMQVNISANVELVRGFITGMRAKQWGRIIFCSSAMSRGSTAQDHAGMYTAVKGALNAYMRTVAAEAGHDNITANAIILGMYYTPLMQNNFDELDAVFGKGTGAAAKRQFASVTALGRLGDTAEVEGMVQLLASDAGKYITGAELPVDGGMSIMVRPHEPREDMV